MGGSVGEVITRGFLRRPFWILKTILITRAMRDRLPDDCLLFNRGLSDTVRGREFS